MRTTNSSPFADGEPARDTDGDPGADTANAERCCGETGPHRDCPAEPGLNLARAFVEPNAVLRLANARKRSLPFENKRFVIKNNWKNGIQNKL